MRDPFDAPVDLINADHNGGNQVSRTGAVSAGTMVYKMVDPNPLLQTPTL